MSLLASSAFPCAGFTKAAEALPGRVPAQCLRLNTAPERCRLTVCFAARGAAALFANHRRLLWRGVGDGEPKVIHRCLLNHPYLVPDMDGVHPFGQVELALCAQEGEILQATAEAADVPAVLVMGDSTVTDQGAASPYAPGATYCGWGQLLPLHLGHSACVGNFARSGLTVETIRTEGLYSLLLSQLRPGDVVLIQFGHNDQKRPHLTANGGYASALERFIQEIRQAGGVPVVVTPLARNSWWDEAHYLDLLADFATAAKDVARRMNAPMIDLHGHMMAFLQSTGREAAKAYFHQGDYTHTNDFGASVAAAFVAAELSHLGLAQAEAFAPWEPYAPYDEPACNQGDESLPPTGLEALYRSYERRGDAPVNRQQALELVLRTCGLFAHNAPVTLPEDIPLNESYSADVRCALQHHLMPDMPDGKFHRLRQVTAAEFTALVRKGYGMRCSSSLPPIDEPLTCAKAAALCRLAKI